MAESAREANERRLAGRGSTEHWAQRGSPSINPVLTAQMQHAASNRRLRALPRRRHPQARRSRRQPARLLPPSDPLRHQVRISEAELDS